MNKKTVLLELPCELIEKIDHINTLEDRSLFIKDLLEKQLQNQEKAETKDITTKMHNQNNDSVDKPKIEILNKKGTPLGSFDINTMEGFENLAKIIQESSEDPMVRIKARRWIE